MQAEGTERDAPHKKGRWRQVIDENLGKVLASSFRQQILWIFNERMASPSEVATELGETLNKVAHHIEVLHDADCIERVEQKLVGNRLQTFYQATARAYIGKLEWEKVPPTVQAGMRATLLSNVLEESVEVVAAEAYDERTAHMSWTTMILDEPAIEEINRVLDRTLEDILGIQDVARQRLATDDSAGFPYSVTLMGYPTLGGEKRVGPPVTANELEGAAESSPSKAPAESKKKSRAKGTTRSAKARQKKEK